MKSDQRILDRLAELIEMGQKVLGTQYNRSGEGFVYLGDDGVNVEHSHQWGTSSLSLLERVFGRESDYYQKFNEQYKKLDDYTPVLTGIGILKSAKDDYSHGYLFETQVLIQAEIFDDFLEQAQHLLGLGYFGPAAVIVGSVLEDGLRKLCQRSGITLSPKPKLDQMNADLAKQGLYNQLVQKRITSLADVRNKAAHGNWSEFDKNDVEDMIGYVRRFMENHFS